VPVYATHSRRREAATYSRYLRQRFVWDLDEADDADTLAYLLEVVGVSIDRPAVLIPAHDAAAIFIAEHSEALRERFIVPEVDPALNRRLVDKRGLHELCEETGTPSPETIFPESREEVEAFAREATFPVVIKAIGGFRLQGLRHPTLIVHDSEELVENFEAMAVGDDLNVMLQQYIPGGPDSIWIFHGYADRDGETVFGLVGNKLREYPVDTGLTTLGVNARNDVVDEAARRFVKGIGYSGVIDIDFRYDARDGQYKPIDFNPRPGANFRLFVDSNGLDVVRAAYLDLTGQRPVAGAQRLGRRWMAANWDLAAVRQYMALDRLTAKGWARSLRGVEEDAWFALDDPAPFFAMLGEFAGFAGAFLTRRLGRE
jgi:predicted ATP-grasp superfamily ATP-dependent carboligase